MLTLEKVKNFLTKKYNLKATDKVAFRFGGDDEDSVTSKLIKWMNVHIDDVAETLLKLTDHAGVDFHAYFGNAEMFDELKEMRISDPDMFYNIIRYEELFLNTCLRMSGDPTAMIHFNIDDLFQD